jgi:hypothetical protein
VDKLVGVMAPSGWPSSSRRAIHKPAHQAIEPAQPLASNKCGLVLALHVAGAAWKCDCRKSRRFLVDRASGRCPPVTSLARARMVAKQSARSVTPTAPRASSTLKAWLHFSSMSYAGTGRRLDSIRRACKAAASQTSTSCNSKTLE